MTPEQSNTINNFLQRKINELKEFIQNRWLYCIAFAFTFIVPLAIITEKIVTVEAERLTAGVSISFGGMVIGLIYLAFVAKKIKAKIEAMELGAARIFFKGVNGIIPFVVAAFLFEVIEKALAGAAFTAWIVVGSLAIGTFFQVVDWEVNKEYLYNLEIDKIAKKQADIDIRKAQLIAQHQAQEEDNI